MLYLFLIRNWIACANFVNIILRVLYFGVLEKNNRENQHELIPAKKKPQKLKTICTRLFKKTKVLRDALVDNYSDVFHGHQIFQMFLSRILYLLPYPTPIYTPATPYYAGRLSWNVSVLLYCHNVYTNFNDRNRKPHSILQQAEFAILPRALWLISVDMNHLKCLETEKLLFKASAKERFAKSVWSCDI